MQTGGEIWLHCILEKSFFLHKDLYFICSMFFLILYFQFAVFLFVMCKMLLPYRVLIMKVKLMYFKWPKISLLEMVNKTFLLTMFDTLYFV